MKVEWNLVGYQKFLQVFDRLRADDEAVDLAYLIAHVQSALSVYHAADEYARYETLVVVAHLERDAHGLVGVFLKLN